MARNLNIWIGTGRLGKDPELKQTTSGKPVCNLSIACQFDQEVDWINIVMFNKQAEALSKYCKKGSMISVSGRLKVRSYEKEGKKNYITEVWVNDFQMISTDSKGGSANNGGTNSGNATAGARPAAQYQAPQDTAGGAYDVGDDIPF